MARSSFAQSCDEILGRYGIKLPPKRQDSTSITTTESPTDNTKDRNRTKQDSVTTTSSSSLPYMSFNDTATSTSTTEPVSSTTHTNTKGIEGLSPSADNSTSHNTDSTNPTKDSQRRLSTSEGAKSKLIQLSSMKILDSTDTASTNTDVTSSNSLDLKGN